MRAATRLQTDTLSELREKFMRLLELDRNSEEFDALFAEVDKELEAHVFEEAREVVA